MDPVFTTNVLCGSSKEQVDYAIRNQTAFVANALSYETHRRYKIPGTCSLGHERVATLTPGRICSEVKQKMKRQTPQLIQRLEATHTDISNAPIILYCAHSECMAAKKLATHLIKSGFTNLYYYKDGVKGWYSA